MFGCCIVVDIFIYIIISGNIGNVFGIKFKIGDIYVVKDLDFEILLNVRFIFIFILKNLCIVEKEKWILKVIFWGVLL